MAVIKQNRIPNPNTQPQTYTVTTEIFNVYADHIDTPRVITKATDQSIVWSWMTAEPFGATPPNQNPNNLGVFTFNQRFPGQVYDAETNLNQNWNREYQGLGGRYLQSDPIGLQGGINTYAYVEGQPTRMVDPEGLQAIPLPPPLPGPTTPGTTPGSPAPKPFYPDLPGGPTYTPAQPNIRLPALPGTIAWSLLNNLTQTVCEANDAAYEACVKNCSKAAQLAAERCAIKYRNDPASAKICFAGVEAQMEVCVIGCQAKYKAK